MNTKKVLPPTYLFVSIVLMIVLHLLFPMAKMLAFPWTLVGLLPFTVGLSMILIVDNRLKKHNSTVKPFEKSTTLITTGLFRISRHPMYVGFVVMLVGIALFMGSVTPYTVIVVLAILLDSIFIRIEEKMLEETFGKTWLEYKYQVRRWI